MSEPSVDTILTAKKVARQNGYNVSLPDNKLDIAKNIAQAAGYNVRKATPVEIAKKTAEEAGYKVRKMNDVEQAMQVAKDAGYTVKKRDTAPAPTPSQVRKQEDKNYSWVEQVAASLM